MLSKLLRFFNHERYQAVSFIIACTLLVLHFGCEPKCHSVFEPTKKISRAELEEEITIAQSRIEAANLSLEQQQEVLDFLFSQAVIASSGQALNPLSVILGIGSILGLGAGIDNIRKRKDVKKLESQVSDLQNS